MRHLVILAAFFAVVLVPAAARAQVPQLLSYQGVLTDAGGNLAPDGLYDLTFRFYAGAVGGAILHDETHVDVPVSRGGFSVLIGGVPGDPLTLPFTIPYWLEIQVAPDALPLSPRIQLASSPYTQMAESVLDNAITAAKISNSAVVGGVAGDVADNTISTDDIANGTITLGDMANNAVASNTILDDEVRSTDLRDEPGVAFDQDGFASQMGPGGIVTAASVTITTPAGGFVLVSYSGYYSDPSHSAGQVGRLMATISEVAGVMGPDATLSIAEIRGFEPSGSISGPPVAKSFIFAKPQGTYSFHLVCQNTGDDEVTITYPVLQALFFPTAYGTALGGTPQTLVGQQPSGGSR